MITEETNTHNKEVANSGAALPSELKTELIELTKNQQSTSSQEDQHNYLCCDLGIDQPDRYQWTTFENCKALGGRAADNSMCGH